MFTKEDYREYFMQIGSLERSMIYNTHNILELLDDAQLRDVINKIGNDEKRHYGYVREILDKILFSAETEKRKFFRDHALARVKVKNIDTAEVFEAYCVNISEGGICIESERNFAPEANLELWVDFLEGKEPQRHFGKLVWKAGIGGKFNLDKIRYQGGVIFQK